MEINSRIVQKDEYISYDAGYSKTYMVIKRILDIIISLFALIILSPVFLIILCLDVFSRSNRGPLFYRQVRIGLHGKDFKMFKFRSMVVDAEKRLYNNPELYKLYVANNFKLDPQDDPRITKLGRFLRRSSIDEIPQFINVLKGDMSLVGPRPVIKPELVEYDNTAKLLSVKPGAMGLWQASGRSDVGYPERANIEMRYIDKASLKFDLVIVWKNVLNVLSRKGAY